MFARSHYPHLIYKMKSFYDEVPVFHQRLIASQTLPHSWSFFMLFQLGMECCHAAAGGQLAHELPCGIDFITSSSVSVCVCACVGVSLPEARAQVDHIKAQVRTE